MSTGDIMTSASVVGADVGGEGRGLLRSDENDEVASARRGLAVGSPCRSVGGGGRCKSDVDVISSANRRRSSSDSETSCEVRGVSGCPSGIDSKREYREMEDVSVLLLAPPVGVAKRLAVFPAGCWVWVVVPVINSLLKASTSSEALALLTGLFSMDAGRDAALVLLEAVPNVIVMRNGLDEAV